MAIWTNQPENGQVGENFFFLIDNTHRFLIDDTHNLLIQDGATGVVWTNQNKN